jgi:predicted SnoaL-like aldol condensation-catalyzing enzyme
VPSRSYRLLAGAILGLALFPLAPLIQAADTDLAKNKALVEGFWNDVFIARNADAAARYLRPDYIQHNPDVPAGLKGFQDFFREQFAQPMKPADLKTPLTKIVAEGDLVMIYVEVSGTDPKSGRRFHGSNFDLFRIQDGLIAKHWDEIMPVRLVPGPDLRRDVRG